MDGFSVSPDELIVAARAFHNVRERVMKSPTAGYGVHPKQVGGDRLAVAVAGAQEASQHAIDVLSGTAQRAVKELVESAVAYRSMDHNAADSLSMMTDPTAGAG